MKVTSPASFSHVAPLGCPVEKGETVDVDDELGAQLVAQGWTAGKGRKGGSAAESASEVAEAAPTSAPSEEQ